MIGLLQFEGCSACLWVCFNVSCPFKRCLQDQKRGSLAHELLRSHSAPQSSLQRAQSGSEDSRMNRRHPQPASKLSHGGDSRPQPEQPLLRAESLGAGNLPDSRTQTFNGANGLLSLAKNLQENSLKLPLQSQKVGIEFPRYDSQALSPALDIHKSFHA